jgi:hypothetical protein
MPEGGSSAGAAPIIETPALPNLSPRDGTGTAAVNGSGTDVVALVEHRLAAPIRWPPVGERAMRRCRWREYEESDQTHWRQPPHEPSAQHDPEHTQAHWYSMPRVEGRVLETDALSSG